MTNFALDMRTASHYSSHMVTKSAASEFGRMGGKARVKNQTAKERSESASRAAKARWAKKKKSAK